MNLSFLDQLLVKSELSALYATCCYAQQIAQMEYAPCDIVCDVKKGSYTCKEHRRVLPKSIMFGVKDGVYGPPAAAHTLVTHPITFKHSLVRSTAQGLLSPGTIYMIDKGYRYQYALSCSVTQVSYIRCYWYDTRFHIMH